MTQEVEKRVIAFVGTVARRCTTCLRRSEANCRNCLSMWANSVLTDIEAGRDGQPQGIDYSYGERCRKILMILTRERRELQSKEIDLGGVCSPQLKLWTLNRLMRRGLIGRRLVYRTRSGYCVYSYFLKREKQETKK